jgi:hypothetical protein
MGWKITGLIWNLGFTVFDVVNAIQNYQNGRMLFFWLFTVTGVIMFVLFLVMLISIIKED